VKLFLGSLVAIVTLSGCSEYSNITLESCEQDGGVFIEGQFDRDHKCIHVQPGQPVIVGES